MAVGMKQGINRLSDKAVEAYVRKAKAGEAPTRRLADGAGLFLTVTEAGSPKWRVRYRYPVLADGVEKLVERDYTIGTYPATSLVDARKERDRVKATLGAGENPVQARRVSKAKAVVASGTTFADVATEWLDARRDEWSAIHHETTKRALERDVYSALGPLPIDSITSPMVADVIKRVLRRGVRDTASKILWNIGCVFERGQALGLCTTNPATPVRSILPKRDNVRRRPALLDAAQLREVLRQFDVANLSPAVRLANRLIAFTGVRIGNAVECEWSELDLDGPTPTWTIPRPKMKIKNRPFPHKVLLGPTIARELRDWRARSRATTGYVFPPPRPKPGREHITRESVEKVMRVTLDLQGKHSVHGWRASLSTLAKDAGFSRDVVELALDHLHDNDVVRAYDRGERLDERAKLMRWWDGVLNPTTVDRAIGVLPLRQAGDVA